MSGPVPEDGRRARGAARREQLVRAAIEVIEQGGVAALTHRAIAEQAGVSLASVSYHFAGIDGLVATALQQATDDLLATLHEQRDHSLAALARLLVEDLGGTGDRLVISYELYLLALRRPHLRPAALSWLEAVADSFAPALRGAERQAFQAAVEGVCLHMLLRDEPWPPEQIETLLRLTWPGARPR
ncbi:TetR family transcriptional regulator [Conexibacter sp. JD483]|uniref:TetR/AcrR family transcriptional regulator n=1 Tax=unclassified Conexibacter TaxID=2627773 RepID=UPI0027252933|nr:MULTISPECIES: TetR family transcriptional regulator [unclassified Conexibacter]MDO8187298.1 TetR family transcriptional regulator [Conexibacter sp. CPCC 205706]MDO8198907.1 TetR family transcriptional regulator [Conexibacter sp. CPCC 205762]MDR9370646.1 TetR family transcriptional regulator [Conexibacter sp. JD483]